jgi:hypothetical protein
MRSLGKGTLLLLDAVPPCKDGWGNNNKGMRKDRDEKKNCIYM